MSSSTGSLTAAHHQFATARGRGYHPDQVERFVQALSDDRDAAWERAARLTVLANDMAAERAAVRERLAALGPARYDVLGPGAQQLLEAAEAEAAAVRERAEAGLRQAQTSAVSVRQAMLRDAEAAAQAKTAAVDAQAARLLEAARTQAAQLRAEAEGEAADIRREADGALDDVRQQAARVAAARDNEQRERLDALRDEFAELAAAADHRMAEHSAYAESLLREAEDAYAAAEDDARSILDQAEAVAADTLAQARAGEERIQRETQRESREHETRCDEIRDHLASVRSGLTTLTGRALPDAIPDTPTDGET